MRTVAVLLLAWALAACTGGAPDHVRIGVVAPLGGPRAYLGHEVRAGAEQAIGDLNDAGGLLGAPVELITAFGGDLAQDDTTIVGTVPSAHAAPP